MPRRSGIPADADRTAAILLFTFAPGCAVLTKAELASLRAREGACGFLHPLRELYRCASVQLMPRTSPVPGSLCYTQLRTLPKDYAYATGGSLWRCQKSRK